MSSICKARDPRTRAADAGFRGLVLLADNDARRLVSLSLWESEEQMHESEASARMITRLATQSVGGKRVAIKPFEVALFDVLI